jgi:hypothetical protein
MKLSFLYHSISKKACETTVWPESCSITRLLHRDNLDSPLTPPIFNDGNGPLALVALFDTTCNSGVLPLLNECLSVR